MRVAAIYLGSAFLILGLGDCRPSGGPTRTDFVAHVRSLAADDAVDCGHIGPGDDSIPVNQCVIDAYWSETPFVAIYDLQRIDSFVSEAIVVDNNGVMFYLTFGSDPAGAGRTDNGGITTIECVDPIVFEEIDEETFAIPIICGPVAE